MKPLAVHMTKTYYPHWSEHTAFNVFLKYFNHRDFKISMQNIPMGNKRFPPIPFLRKYCQKKIKKRRMGVYKLNDLRGELSVLCRSLFKKVDVIHIIDAEHSLMFLPYWYKKLRRLKTFPRIIAMFHQPPSILESLINIEVVKQADHVLVVSPTQADYFEQYLPSQQISTILLGVDTHHFKPSQKKRSEKFRCLGGGIWLRDFDAIFKTAKILESIPEIEFHIVAPSRDNPGNEKLHSKNIIFHENIPDQSLLELYQNCDILFLPFEDATANTFLLEGSACGLPVISSDLPSIKTYFPGEEAILIKDNDQETFADVIIDLNNNRSKLFRMSQLARKRALELCWSKICKEYERVYMKIIGIP